MNNLEGIKKNKSKEMLSILVILGRIKVYVIIGGVGCFYRFIIYCFMLMLRVWYL